MASLQPAVRAGAIHDALAFLDVFEPGARGRVLERIPAASREILLNTARSSWVDVEHDRHAVDAIVQLFGAATAVQYWRRATSKLSERPLLRSFVSGMISLLGDDPGRVIGLLPQGWSLVYRDFCTVVCDRSSPGSASLRFEQVAPQVRAAANYFHSWHGTCLGVADLARMRGQVDFTVAAQGALVTAKFIWQTQG